MTGAFRQFLDDLRGPTTGDDPLVDLDTLPPEFLDPIRDFIDQHRTRTSFERQAQFFGLKIAIRHNSRIRLSDLIAVYDRFSELAVASERAIRQQTARLEAEHELALAEGRADNLRGRLVRATRAEAEASQRLGDAQALNDALGAQVAALKAERDAADLRVDDLAIERDALIRELTADRQAAARADADLRERLKKMAARGKQVTEMSEQILRQKGTLRAEIQRVTAERQMIEADRTDLRRRLEEAGDVGAAAKAAANRAAAERDRLAEQLERGRPGRQHLENKVRHWKAQAQGNARAVARYQAKNAALEAENTKLAADKEVLEDVNWWLQERLRFRGRPVNAANDG